MRVYSYDAKSCPKCGFGFTGRGISSHARKCGLGMADLFWMKVNKDAPNGCWIWMASQKERGYGQFLHKGKMHRSHRLAWTLSGRALPTEGLELAHSCHNKLCVNPDHLRPISHAENMRESKDARLHMHGEKACVMNVTHWMPLPKEPK